MRTDDRSNPVEAGRQDRRSAIKLLGSLAMFLGWRRWERFANRVESVPAGEPKMVSIVEFTDGGKRTRVVALPKVVKTEAEWKKQLPSASFEVTRHAATERPFTGALLEVHDKGVFRCICCDTAL